MRTSTNPGQRSQTARSIANGLVISVVSLASALSYAALIFSGLLSSGLAEGVSSALVGSAVVALVIARRSAFPFAVAGVDAYHSAVLGGIAAAMAVTLQSSGRVATVNALYLVLLSGLLTGALLYALGAARMGRWIRFVPYPVTGGFMAGVGWLMVAGGIQVVTNLPVTLANLPELFSLPLAYKLAAGLAWAALLYVVLRRGTHFMVLPGLLVGGALACLASLAAGGISFEQARTAGWLFATPADSAWWMPWAPANLALLELPVLAGYLQDLLILTLVNTLTILMSSTGLELETRHDIDLDRELQTHGLAQLASAAVGGFPGFVSTSRSLLNHRLGSVTRLAGYVAAAATLLYAFVGPVLVSFMPKAILGGLIIYMGATLILTWVWSSRKSCSWSEYLTILLIAMAVTVWGFVTGVVLGVVAACLMFAISYSRVSAVKHLLSGAVYSSSMVRASAQADFLKRNGEDIRIFVLQGFVFFGTADRLYRIFGEQLVAADRPVRYVILDFRFVSGIDSSAVSSFRKIAALAEKRGAILVTSGIGPQVAFELAPLIRSAWAHGHQHLDAGLEWCESEMLRRFGPDETMTVPTITDWLAREFGDRAAAVEFLRHVEKRDVAEGEFLCRQGEVADSMFFIGEGMVVVEHAGADGKPQRLRTLGRHTMIGEMGLYRSELRSASVVARANSKIYVLTREALDRMRSASPELAEALCVSLIKTMAERLSFANSLNATLQG